jgi:X-Pro dipeptidyl-peptidase
VDYPNPEARNVTLLPGGDGSATGSLTLSAVGTAKKLEFVDDVSQGAPALAKAASSPNRLLFATTELKTPLHISGTAKITLRLASNAPAANLSVCLVQLPWTDGAPILNNLITRGWADPQNHRSLRTGGNFASFERGTPLKPGEFVNLTFDLQPDDQVIPAGRKIGLMIFSSDREYTLWPKAGTKLTVDLAGTRLVLPVVGGAQQLVKVLGGA